MNAIFFLLRTGAPWNSLNATGICSKSSAYRRFREWTEAGVFEEFWKQGLLAYDELKGIDWSWLAMDGALTKAPLAGSEKTGRNPTDRGKQGVKRSLLTEAKGIPLSVVARGANRHDMKLVEETLASLQAAPPLAAAGEPRGICLDKRGMTPMRCAPSWRRSGSPRTFVREVRKRGGYGRKRGFVGAGGWWNEPTVG